MTSDPASEVIICKKVTWIWGQCYWLDDDLRSDLWDHLKSLEKIIWGHDYLMTSDPISEVIWGHLRSLEKYFEVIRGQKRNIKRSEQFVYDCLVTSMPQCLNDLKFDLRGHLRSFEVTWGHIRSKLTIYEYSYTKGDHSDTIRNLRSQRSLRSLRSLRLKIPK